MSKSSRALSDLNIIILAGGLGTRLREVVPDRQKVMANVGQKPFMCFLLDQLLQFGATHAILCTGYQAEQVHEMIGDIYWGLPLTYSKEDQPMGTGGALRLALPLIRSAHTLVLNGDSLCEVDLGAFRASHESRGASGSLVLAPMADSGRYGSVEIDDGDRIIAFREKDPAAKGGWINAGVYLLDVNLIRQIPEDKVVSLERDMFPKWINNGLWGYRTHGRFIDIGTPESYALAEQFVSALQGGQS